jgi:hypothetical protein
MALRPSEAIDKLRLASLLIVKNPQRNYHYASGFSLLAPSGLSTLKR